MLKIPRDLLGRFAALLEKRGIPSVQRQYYRKWLRYYLDFCGKYRLEATSSKSASQFQAKLREKRQTDLQIRQAAHAVSLYWDVQRALKARPTASPAESLSKTAEAAKPYRLPAELRDPPSCRRTMMSAQSRNCWATAM